MFRQIGFAALMACQAAAAFAGGQVGTAEACFSDAATAHSDPAACVDAAQIDCLDNAVETPAVANLCLKNAQAAWSDALGARFASVVANADPAAAATLRIETKYDLLATLMQCDRMQELALATSDLTGPAIAVQTARCQATAAGLTYMRLYLRTQTQTKSE